jgi:hypothetical protein
MILVVRLGQLTDNVIIANSDKLLIMQQRYKARKCNNKAYR